jgi:hypothetical protein
MAAIKFPFIKCRLNLIFRPLSILDWSINIESLLLRYLAIAAPRAISILNLLALGVEKQGIYKKTWDGRQIAERSYPGDHRLVCWSEI